MKAMTHADREYTAFIDRVRDRHRKSGLVVGRNRWVEPIQMTRQNAYDQETERQRAFVHHNERRTA